jgi:hypothetical protein
LPFTDQQLSNIRQRTLGDIICDNTAVPEVNSNVFLLNTGLGGPRKVAPSDDIVIREPVAYECSKRNPLDLDHFVF